MSLVEHAERELRRTGAFDEDSERARSIVDAVRAFAGYGHSGGSAAVGIAALHDLLQGTPLGPLTDHPAEWQEVGPGVWQSRRRADAFSSDGGRTFHCLDEPVRWWRRLLRRGPRVHAAVTA